MTVWTQEQARRWLAEQLRQDGGAVEERVEEQLALGITVEPAPLPHWPEIAPLFDTASRQFLEEVLQRPALTRAEETPLLERWLEEREKINSVLNDQEWWEPLWDRLEEMVKAARDPLLSPEDAEPLRLLGQRAAELQQQLAGLNFGLDRLLSLGAIPPRLLQMLGLELLQGLGDAGRALDPVLGRRLERTAALCWRYLPDPLHFLVLMQRPIRGLLAAVDRLDLPNSERLDARAGWLQNLEMERFLLEREQLAQLSAELAGRLGRPPTLEEMGAARYRPLDANCPARQRECLEERNHTELLNSLLDHWEMDQSLFELGRAQKPLSSKELEQAEKLRLPSHSLAETRVLMLRYGLSGPPKSVEETAFRLQIPELAVRRLENLATRKWRDSVET